MPKLIILHGAIYILGFIFLRLFLSLNNRNWSNYLVFSYPAGLVISCAAVFSLNQFLGVKITYPSLLIIALPICIILALINYFLPLGMTGSSLPDCKPVTSESIKTNKQILVITIISAILLISIAAIYLLKVVLEPLDDWDAFLYHLPIARHIFVLGSFPNKISPSYMEMENAYPPLFFFLYSLNMLALGTIEFISPKITFIVVTLLCFLIFYKIQRRLWGISLLSFLFSIYILVWYTAAYGMIKPNMYSFTLLYFLSGLYFFLSGEANNSASELYLAAIFWAGAYWANYIGMFSFAVIFTIWIILYLASRHKVLLASPSSINLGTILICTLIFIIAVSPHILRNWIRLGNPFYPGFPNIFGGYLMDEWTIKNAYIKNQGPSLSLLKELVWGKGNLIFILAVLLCMEIDRKEYYPSFALIYIILYTLIWATFFQLTSAPVSRYLILVYAVIALYMGQIMEKAISGRLKSSSTYYLLIFIFSCYFINKMNILFLLPVTFISIAIYLSARKYLDQIYREYCWQSASAAVIGTLIILQHPAYLMRDSVRYVKYLSSIPLTNLKPDRCYLELLPDMEWIERNLPPTAKILIFEDRLFFLTRDYMPGDDPGLKAFYQSENIAQALHELKKQGITHFYYRGRGDSKYKPFTQSVFAKFLDNKNIFNVVYKPEKSRRFDVRIYKINYNAYPFQDSYDKGFPNKS